VLGLGPGFLSDNLKNYPFADRRFVVGWWGFFLKQNNFMMCIDGFCGVWLLGCWVVG